MLERRSHRQCFHDPVQLFAVVITAWKKALAFPVEWDARYWGHWASSACRVEPDAHSLSRTVQRSRLQEETRRPPGRGFPARIS